MEENIKILRICLKDDNDKILIVFKNIKKDTPLNELREKEVKGKKISQDYVFVDEGRPIDEDMEEQYNVEDVIKGEKPFIYIQKKINEKNNNTSVNPQQKEINKITPEDNTSNNLNPLGENLVENRIINNTSNGNPQQNDLIVTNIPEESKNVSTIKDKDEIKIESENNNSENIQDKKENLTSSKNINDSNVQKDLKKNSPISEDEKIKSNKTKDNKADGGANINETNLKNNTIEEKINSMDSQKISEAINDTDDSNDNTIQDSEKINIDETNEINKINSNQINDKNENLSEGNNVLKIKQKKKRRGRGNQENKVNNIFNDSIFKTYIFTVIINKKY